MKRKTVKTKQGHRLETAAEKAAREKMAPNYTNITNARDMTAEELAHVTIKDLSKVGVVYTVPDGTAAYHPDYPRTGYAQSDPVNHPQHYGGGDNVYEAIKVIEAWKLGFNLGNTVKYIARADHKGTPIQDLKKARWYLDREISNREMQR